MLTDSVAGNFMLLQGLGADFDAPPPTSNPASAADFPNEVTEADPDPEDETVYLGPGAGASFTADDPEAPLLRQHPDETFSRFDAATKTWVPFTPPSGERVSQLPQSALTVALDPGDSRLPIIEQPLLKVR